MPEKIRAAVTSKEIAPEEHSLQKNNDRKTSALPSECVVNTPSQPCESDASSSAVIEQLDEKALKEIATEADFALFKKAWIKSIEANEEVNVVVLIYLWYITFLVYYCCLTFYH